MQITPGTQLDRYLIQGILGEGAMAVVYQAQHAELGSLHAIKRLKIPSRQVQERLVQEGRLQSSLQHPNVLSVTDLLTVDGAPALVMEFVAGPTLADLMASQTLTMDQRDALARDLLKGVAAAHAHGLVHRDLKPANVLVAVTDDSLVPKVADFGLAKIMEGDEPQAAMTRTGATMGTPAYMAPEQIRDSSNVDARADVFSLGAILYEMVTGSSCFLGGNVMEIWERICSGSYRPVTDHKTEIPTRMIRAIEQALVVDPEHRLQTVSELYACWCTDDAGQHVAVPGRQSLDFWPESLRSETSAMAPSWDIAPDSTGHSPEGDSSTLLFVADQTTDWGGDNDSPPPTLAPPSSGSTPPPDTPPPSKPIGWMVMAAVAAGAMGVWSQRPDAEPTSPTTDVADARSAVVGNESPPMETRDSIANPESHMSADHLSAQTPTNNETVSVADPAHPGLSNSIFKLSATAPKSDQQTLLVAQEALLRANYPLAERHLNALAEQHPTEPAIHSLLSLTHYFRGHLGLSAGASRRAAYLSRQQETNAAAIYQLVDRSWREPDNSEELLRNGPGFEAPKALPWWIYCTWCHPVYC